MDGYQFIAALVASLSWPVAAIALGLTFRRPILALLGKVTSLKAAGIEMTVAERSAEAVEELPALPATVEPVVATDPPETDSADDPDLAPTVPASSAMATATAEGYVLRAWKKLEAALRRASGSSEIEHDPSRLIDRLVAEDKLPGSLPSAIWQLRKIRNDVVHGRASVTMIDAMTFDAAVTNVIRSLPTERQRESMPDIAASIQHQGEAATMSVRDIRSEIERQEQQE